MKLRDGLAMCVLLSACSRPQPGVRPIAAQDAGARAGLDPTEPAQPTRPVDAGIPPAVRQMMAMRASGDVPAPTPPPADSGPNDRVVTSANGGTARVTASNFALEASITHAPNATTGRLAIALRGAGGTTVNAGYPITIELSANALQLSKTSVRRGDATTYTPQLARFEVNLTDAQQGETVTAELLFSVCRGTDCSFESRRMVLVVP